MMKWYELLGIKITDERLNSLPLSELREQKTEILDGLRRLLDRCDEQQRPNFSGPTAVQIVSPRREALPGEPPSVLD